MTDQNDRSSSEAAGQAVRGSGLPGKLSRAQLLGAAAGAAAASLPLAAQAAGKGYWSYPYYPRVSGTYTPESLQDILNNIVTPAYFAATAITVMLGNPAAYGLSGLPLTITHAILAEEQDHIDFWSAQGAVPVVTTFTIPASLVGNPAGALAASEVSATIQVAAFMTAVRAFAELGQPELAKWAYQTGAQEAEQRATYRFLGALTGNSADVPPNNKAFETDLFLYTRDAVDAYRALGLIGGSGVSVTYPGREAVLALAGPSTSAVSQTTPNDASSSVAITGLSSLTQARS